MSKDSCSGFASTEIAADKPFILRQVSQTRAKNQHCPKQCDTEINAYVGSSIALQSWDIFVLLIGL